MGERAQEILVERVALAVDALLLVHLGRKAPALLVRVGELAEGVRELDPADVKLEALREPGIVGRAAREGGFRERVFVEDRRAPVAEPRLDALDPHAAAGERPAVVF